MTDPTSCLQCEDNDAADGQYGDHKKDSQSSSGAMSASEPDLTQQVNECRVSVSS